MGLICPSNNPHLVTEAGTANSAIWVIGIRLAGIKALPSVINAGLISNIDGSYSEVVSLTYVTLKCLLRRQGRQASMGHLEPSMALQKLEWLPLYSREWVLSQMILTCTHSHALLS